MQRRQFLTLLLGSALPYAIAGHSHAAASISKQAYLYSATDNPQGGHFLTRLALQTKRMDSQAVSIRGHAVMPLVDDRVILFGRRPAFQCALVDFVARHTQAIQASAGRHFNGHGCLSATGEVLFTSENDYDGRRGVLGIRDSQTFEHLGEYDTAGLDPHDVRLMPDQKTLVIANGGIETHPDFRRRKLNIPTMQPSLVYLDSETGKKLAEYRLPDHLLSIRHLTVTDEGDVGVALQYEGDLYRQQPSSLVAWQSKDQDLQLLSIDEAAITPLNGYMADLAYDPQQQLLAVTSPRGNQVSFWDIAKQRFIMAQPLRQVSGIQFIPELSRFLVSTASGEVQTLHVNTAMNTIDSRVLYRNHDVLWDNHLIIS